MKPFRGLDKRARNVLGYTILAFLIGLSVAAFLMLQHPHEPAVPFEYERAEEGLREGINQYRQGNFERARLLLQNILGNTRENRTASMAALYLGNISFQEGVYGTALQHYEESLALDKKNIYALHNAAVASARNGNWRKAQVFSRKAWELSGDFTPAVLFLANLHYGAGRFGRAAELYARGGELQGVFEYNRARALLQDGNRAEAIDRFESIASAAESDTILRGLSSYAIVTLCFGTDDAMASAYMEQAAQVFPSSPPVQVNRALLLAREDRYAEGAALMRSMDRVSSPDFATLYGYVLYRSGRFDEALTIWVESYLENRDTRVARILGDIHFMLENWEEAERYYRMAVEDQAHLEVYENLAQVYIAMGAHERAAEICTEYVSRAPGDPSPLLCLADLSFQLDRVQTGKEALSRARKLIGDDAQGLMRVGSLYAQYGMYNSALHLYQRILDDHPDRVALYGRIAEIYLQTGHPARAREQFEKALHMTTDPKLFYNLSVLLALAEGGREGQSRYQELIREYPYRYEAYYNAALLAIQQEDYTQALRTVSLCFDQVTNMDDTLLSKLHTLSGIASARMGTYDEAARYFSKARELDGSNEPASINLKLVQEGMY